MGTLVNSVELVSRLDCRNICKKDAVLFVPTYDQDLQNFVKKNEETWYVLTNVWLLMIKEKSHRTAILVEEGIRLHGLVYMINDASEAADALISDLAQSERPVLSNYWLYLIGDLSDTIDALRDALTILRFGKRLSPEGATKVKEASIEKFLNVNQFNATKYVKFDSPGQYGRRDVTVANYDCNQLSYLWNDIKQSFRELCPSFMTIETKDDQKAWEDYFYENGEFSHGSTYEGAKTLSEKVKCLSKHYAGFDNRSFSYPMINTCMGISKGNKEEYLVKHQCGKTQVWVSEMLPPECRVVAVNKSYKAARIIAKEQVWRAYSMQAVRKLWVEHSKHAVVRIAGRYIPVRQLCDVEDQNPNQEKAWEASCSGVYTTYDFSSASDSIDKTIGYELTPEFNWFWEKYRSKYFVIGDRRYKSHIFLTSGTPITFKYESDFFLSVARTATDYCALFNSPKVLETEWKLDHKRGRCPKFVNREFIPPQIFGDDTLVDCRVQGTFEDLAAALGLKINREKSFGTETHYRESCGVEYYNGYPMHTIKWPRKTLTCNMKDADNETVASMISLQHRVHSFSWDASQFLCRWVLAKRPKMTYSEPNVDCDDLWSEVHKPSKVVAPMGKPGDKPKAIQDCALYELRELHSVLSAEYPKPLSLDNNVEMYNYVSFLKNGPRYASDLDRELQVTEPLNRRAQYAQSTSNFHVKRQ